MTHAPSAGRRRSSHTPAAPTDSFGAEAIRKRAESAGKLAGSTTTLASRSLLGWVCLLAVAGLGATSCSLERGGLSVQSEDDTGRPTLDARVQPDSGLDAQVSDARAADSGGLDSGLPTEGGLLGDGGLDSGLDSSAPDGGGDAGPLFTTTGTFTRTSLATLETETTLERVDVNVARERVFGGLSMRLIEGPATNLLRGSEIYQSSLPDLQRPWTSLPAQPPSVRTPDGAPNQTCFIIAENGFGPSHRGIGLIEDGTVANPVATTLSVWSRAAPDAGDSSPLRLDFLEGYHAMRRTVGSEWRRLDEEILVDRRANLNMTVEGRRTRPSAEDPPLAQNVCLWAWQYERSEFPTSYIGPTSDDRNSASPNNHRAADVWVFDAPPMSLLAARSRIVVRPLWASDEVPNRAWLWNSENGVGLAFEASGASLTLALYSGPGMVLARTPALTSFPRGSELVVDFDPNGSVRVEIDGGNPLSQGFNAPNWPELGALRIGGAYDAAADTGEELFGWLTLPARL